MAGDRHGKHNTTTISFRVNSYEKATIEERVKASGMKKQDYIVRSCVYNHVCVVGKRENIEMDLCQYFGHKKLKGYADFFNSSSSFCCGVI